jgi:hypothetical protein
VIHSQNGDDDRRQAAELGPYIPTAKAAISVGSNSKFGSSPSRSVKAERPFVILEQNPSGV